MTINAYAALSAGGELTPFQYDPGELLHNQVQIKIESCGVCHSDLSMWRNEWGMTAYPFVPGHEVIGTVEAVGAGVHHLSIGQRVGAGWFSDSCMTCNQCLSGDHNLCGSAEGIIIERFGGFADRVRVGSSWAIPLPDGLPPEAAGPLFCGGITVFNPIVQLGIKPTDRVGVVGIGGLGHMALQFLSAWGCSVTAFTSNPEKAETARQFGASQVVNSRDSDAITALGPVLDMILVTPNVSLDWDAYIQALRPKGRLHIVGAVLEPIPISVFSLLTGQKSVSASPLGSPATIARMLEFAARHSILPDVETMPMSRINKAFERLDTEQPARRLVLLPDFV